MRDILKPWHVVITVEEPGVRDRYREEYYTDAASRDAAIRPTGGLMSTRRSTAGS